MSVDPYFNCYQNSNNITLVPSVVNNSDTDSQRLPVYEQIPKEYVIPGFQANDFVINYSNLHFNGCANTSNYIYSPFIPASVNTQPAVINNHYTEYGCPSNLVNLTGLDYVTTTRTNTYPTYSNSFEHDRNIINYDYLKYSEIHNNQIYPHQRKVEFEAAEPAQYQILESNYLSIDDMSSRSITMKKYNKYDDLRDVIEERHINSRGSENIRVNKNEEGNKDLKNLLPCRSETINKTLKTKENERALSRSKDLKCTISTKSVKLKTSISSIEAVKNTLSKTSHNTRTPETKFPPKNMDINRGLLERKTISKAQKSSLSPDALQRYLAYQRFLRHCYKSPSPRPQRKMKLIKNRTMKDSTNSGFSESEFNCLKLKEKIQEKIEKIDEKIEKYTKNITHLNSKEKIKTQVKGYKDQKGRKEESNSKIKSEQMIRKEKSKINIIKEKKNETKIKEEIVADYKKKKDVVNEKLAGYMTKNKEKQDLKERLFGSVDNDKGESDSKAKLIKCFKQTRKRKSESTDVSVKSSNCNSQEKLNSVDLRTVLTNKRNKNSLDEAKRIKTTKSQGESLTITVKQDINNKPEPSKFTHNATKVKPIKSKRIKLVINIVYPNSSDSDDSDQSTKDRNTSPHQDLSFLDDFNVDEIVDSLNVLSNKTPICQNNSETNDNNISTNVHKPDTNKIESSANADHIQQKELNIPAINNTNNDNEDHQLDMYNNEQIDCVQACKIDTTHKDEEIINISDDLALPVTDIRLNLEPVYYDDVYEVIDISDDANGNIVLEEDIINLDSNDHHENIELLTKSSINFKEKAESILLVSDSIIKKIQSDNKVKNISNNSDQVRIKSDLIPQNIEVINIVHEKTKPNIREKDCAPKENKENILDMSNTCIVAKETTLENIDSNKQNIIPGNKNKNGQDIDSLLANIFNTENNDTTTKPEELLKSDVLIKHPEDSVEKTIPNQSSKLLDFQNISEKIQTEVQYITPVVHIVNQHKDKSEDRESNVENKSNIEPQHVEEKMCVDSENDVDKFKQLNENKSDNESDITQTLNPTTTNTTNDKHLKVSTKSKESYDDNTQEKSIIKPNKIENGSNIEQHQNNLKENLIANVVINNTSRTICVPTDKCIKNKQNIKANRENTLKKEEKIAPLSKTPYIKDLENRMFEYLNEKFNITAVLHRGYFSTIYKCKDDIGNTRALKVIRSKYRTKSIYRDNILTDLQKFTTEDRFIGIIRMIQSFNFAGEWCILTNFYPKTLEEAFLETGKCFHIDLVQILARQLVSAVTMLTNNQIIHSDIKPSHILLNNTNDKLKLCSFDRSEYSYNIRIIPGSGTASYRAPEMILGFDADYRIDVWATALVMYEMATGIQLFPGRFNNDILFKQLCTLGPLNYDMLEKCSLRHMHFVDSKFMRQVSNEKWVFVQFCGINNKLRHKLFASYNRDWKPSRTRWQRREDLDKIEALFKLLKQMLIMDPRHRLPITYVAANEFIYG